MSETFRRNLSQMWGRAFLKFIVAIMAQIALVVGLLPCKVAAQDSHWGTILYGDRSTLLGGAVIASVDDASAAYYNPGALADVAPKDFFLATKVFDFTKISVSSEETDFVIDTDEIGRAPTFIGGMIPIKTGEHRLAYSFFKRQSFNLRLTETFVGETELPQLTDVSSARLNIVTDTNLNDDWVGLSWAYPLFKRTRIGLSMFASYRSHRFSSIESVESFRNDGTVGTAMVTREYKYGYSSLVWKLGVKHQYNDHFDMGFSLTTPNVGIGVFSDGDAGVSATASSIRGLNGDQDRDSFIADYQKNLSATYKTPWGFGLGGAYEWSKRSVHASVELFGSVDLYDVVDPEPFIAQSTGDTLDHPVTAKTLSVLNFGIGLEEHVSESIEAFFGFHTDFSSADDEAVEDVYITKWNLYHLTGGSQFMLWKAQFTLGLGYVFGSEPTSRFVTINDVVEPDLPGIGELGKKVNFQRLKLIFGFGIRT
jgi:hypothetical protein